MAEYPRCMAVERRTVRRGGLDLYRYGGLLIGVALFLFAAPFAYRQANSYDGSVMERVAVGIADHGDPLVSQQPDEFGLNTPYSNYGIGTSVVMAPLHLAARAVGADPLRSMNLVDAVFVGGTGIAVFETLRRRGVSRRSTIVTTVLVTVGSPLLAYALTDFSEPGIALTIALGVLGLDGVVRETRYAALGVGAAVGGAVLLRSDSLGLVGVPFACALLLLSRRRTRDAGLFAVGIAPFLAGWAWYNAARFHSLFGGGYRYQGFTHPLLPGLYGLTLAPGRGVFVYAPLIVVGLVVVPKLRGADRVLGVLAVVLLVLRIVFYARWWAWYGGSVWGPRFLVPVIPAFAPALATALERWSRSRAVAVAVVLTVAMSFVGVWGTMHPELNPYVSGPVHAGDTRQIMAQFTSTAYVDRTDHIMFDWSRFPLRSARTPEP
jgi:hypothetical protein